MGDAKSIRVAMVSAKDARAAVERWHYSGRTVNNSQLHFGVFLDGALLGAMQFGPPMRKDLLLGLVESTPWDGMLELNRMAFADRLPRNSESRALSVAFMMLKRHVPRVQWVVSFADAAQCGDGTIYRASGFVLTGIKTNTQIWQSADRSKTVTRFSVTKGKESRENHGSVSMRRYTEAGFKPIPGFQIRYLYFLDPTARERLTVPILPFSKIKDLGAGMYLGKPRVVPSGGSPSDRETAFEPTTTLQDTCPAQPQAASQG